MLTPQSTHPTVPTVLPDNRVPEPGVHTERDGGYPRLGNVLDFADSSVRVLTELSEGPIRDDENSDSVADKVPVFPRTSTRDLPKPCCPSVLGRLYGIS